MKKIEIVISCVSTAVPIFYMFFSFFYCNFLPSHTCQALPILAECSALSCDAGPRFQNPRKNEPQKQSKQHSLDVGNCNLQTFIEHKS